MVGFEVIVQEKIHGSHSGISKPDWSLPVNIWNMGMSLEACPWSDEIKLELFGYMDATYVWQRMEEAFSLSHNWTQWWEHNCEAVKLL